MSLKTVLDVIKGVDGLDSEAIVKEVTETYGTAEAASKIRATNEQWKIDNETREAEKKQLKAEKTDLESQIKTLSQGSGDKGEKAELQAQLNRVAGDLTKVTEDLEKEKEARKVAEGNAQKSKLRADMVDLLKTKNALKPGNTLTLMLSEKLIGTDAEGQSTFHRRNDKNELETATAEESVDAYLKNNPEQIAPSGNAGAGTEGSGGDPDKPFVALDNL